MKPGYRWRILAYEDGKPVEMANRGCFDELVIDSWLHLEQMNDRTWWMRLGDVWMWIDIDEKGNSIVDIRRGEYSDIRGKTEV